MTPIKMQTPSPPLKNVDSISVHARFPGLVLTLSYDFRYELRHSNKDLNIEVQ